MSRGQLMDRMLSSVADVELFKIRSGKLSEKEWDRVRESRHVIASMPVYIDDQAALHIREIRSRARQMKIKHGTGLIVLDYMQLIRNPRDRGSREQEISEISQSLKAMAKELDVPVLALSQLNRGVEARPDKLRMAPAQQGIVLFMLVVFVSRPDGPAVRNYLLSPGRRLS